MNRKRRDSIVKLQLEEWADRSSDDMPCLHDADWLATLLGVSRQRAYALAREGLVPCVRIGRKVAFDERAVFRWIEQGGSAEPGATGFTRR